MAAPEGNKNRWKGGRLKLDLSLSGRRKDFFAQLAQQELHREPSDKEILDAARRWYYAQDEQASINNDVSTP